MDLRGSHPDTAIVVRQRFVGEKGSEWTDTYALWDGTFSGETRPEDVALLIATYVIGG